jgi:hypothetical protein
MLASVLVMLLGAGICASGVLVVDLYFAGVVVFAIGAIGFLVWAVEWAVPLLRSPRR